MENNTQTIIGRILSINEQSPTREVMRLLLSGKESPMTYNDIIENAGHFAAYLTSNGVGKGDVVVIILPLSPLTIYAYIGAMLVGAIPAYYAYPSAKLSIDEYGRTIRALLETSEAAYIFCYNDLYKNAKKWAKGLASLKGIVSDKRYSSKGDSDFTPVDIDADDIAFLQFSSGTTGIKKGVALTNAAALVHLDNYAKSIKLDAENDTIVSWLPLYHDMGLIACMLLPLVTGTRTITMSPFEWVVDPVILFEAVDKYNGTLSWLPNFAFDFCARNVPNDRLAGLDLSSLRAVINCAEPVRMPSMMRFVEKFESFGFAKSALAASYAMAENTFAVTQTSIGKELALDTIDTETFVATGEAVLAKENDETTHTLVSSGTPIADTEMRIVDDNRIDLPDRQMGEIAIRSPYMLKEYRNNPEKTAQVLSDGWYYTGDLGYTVGDELFVIGRGGDMIIVAGKNVYPEDVEYIASSIKGIYAGRVVAFGVFNEKRGTQELVILAEAEKFDESRNEKIITAISEAVLAGTDVQVGAIQILPPRTLVKSTSGKIARSANKEKYIEEISQKETAVSGGDSREELLIDFINTEMSKKPVRPITEDDKLISSGLVDSVSLIEVIVFIEEQFGVKIPPRRVQPNNFDTIELVVGLIDRFK